VIAGFGLDDAKEAKLTDLQRMRVVSCTKKEAPEHG